MPPERGPRAAIVAAPGSGQGKTWTTAALARRCAREGLRVRVLKTGPDFIDAAILQRASGSPVHSLDLWMCGEDECARRLADAARAADVLLVEGAMGLFDGQPSTADLARRFGLPVLLVVDAGAMAETFGAVVLGLTRYDPDLRVAGVLANRVAGPGHAEMLQRSLRDPRGWCGCALGDPTTSLPERHLGLVMPEEIQDLDARIDRAADGLRGFDLELLPRVELVSPAALRVARQLEGVTIAVARDPAFCFVYAANLDLLRELGAELSFFSPRDDARLPEANALYLPGGYPELHADALARNASMRASVKAHIDAGKPALAECGGLMLLARTLSTLDGARHEMVGALDLEVEMQPRLMAIGHYRCALAEGALRGHAFHHSSARGSAPPSERADATYGAAREPVYRRQRLVASYVHWYLPSNPDAAARLLRP
jgi:cobyrinic acid a,c-diamide synthase